MAHIPLIPAFAKIITSLMSYKQQARMNFILSPLSLKRIAIRVAGGHGARPCKAVDRWYA